MAHSHFHVRDPQAQLDAIASDLEYFRAKRLEPRIFHLARRGVVPLSALFRASQAVGQLPSPPIQPDAGADLDARILALQNRLDDFVLGVGTVFLPTPKFPVPIDEVRRERGDYDEYFHFTKRAFAGSLEERVRQLEQAFGEVELTLATYRSALVETGLTSEDDLRARREQLTAVGHRNGARLVARAWVDPEFKKRLMTEGRQVARELDIPPGKLGRLGVAENTSQVHNVVVCTLCSCYPSDLLGDPPWWYRTEEYRTQVVRDPRQFLSERFGLTVPPEVRIHVHDSTSDVRWMVLPCRPEGTEAYSEEELARLVTPESLVGTGLPVNPVEARG